MLRDLHDSTRSNRSAEIIHAKIGQFAFQAFDVQPKRSAMAEQQHHAAAWRFFRMKLDPQQIQCNFRRLQIDIARFARQHAVKAQRRDQATRARFSRQRLLPIQPVHADHEPLFALPPNDVGGLHAGVLHMRRNHGEVVGIERDQFELGRDRMTYNFALFNR